MDNSLKVQHTHAVCLDTSSSSITSSELDSTIDSVEPISSTRSRNRQIDSSASSEQFCSEDESNSDDFDSVLCVKQSFSEKRNALPKHVNPTPTIDLAGPTQSDDDDDGSRSDQCEGSDDGSRSDQCEGGDDGSRSDQCDSSVHNEQSSPDKENCAPTEPRKVILISPQRKAPSVPSRDEGFKLARTYKTLQRQLEVIEDMHKNMSARLPDGGAQLRTQRNQIIARMNAMKNPRVCYGPVDEAKVMKSKQLMMNKQLGALTTGAVEQLYKTLEDCPSVESMADDPRGLKVSLFPHQKQGLAWTQWRERQSPGGGILADEMGLGKTLTMLSLIVSSLKDDRRRNLPADKGLLRSFGTLIVCPKSLMLQWESEIRKRFEQGLLYTHVYHGSGRTADPRRLTHFDVILTTYNLVASEFQSFSSKTESGGLKKRKAQFHPLFQVHWNRVILDEAHTIRNPDTAISQGASALTSDYRWCVTGTPIQNKELDMYALIRFLKLAPFNDRTVWRQQVQKGSKGIQRMNALVKGLVLRRMKTDLGLDGKQLVELPEKKITFHQLTLSEEEQAIHDAIFGHTKITFQKWLNKKQGESTAEPEKPKEVSDLVRSMSEVVFSLGIISTADPDLSSGYSFILCLLLRFSVVMAMIRQSCVHPNLLVSKTRGHDAEEVEDTDSLSQHLKTLSLGGELGSKEEQLCGLGAKKELKLPPTFDVLFHSTRINALMKEIVKVKKTAPNDKCVVFSQWTSMIDIIELNLMEYGISYNRIDGQVSPHERQRLVDTFNSAAKSPEVLTVSLLAGGVGLNLIGGNHIFIMDLHWNPFNEMQACDRVHRVGQTKEVHVHRFFCANTIEERIVALQDSKKEMAGNVLSGAGVRSSNKLSLEDLKALFQVM